MNRSLDEIRQHSVLRGTAASELRGDLRQLLDTIDVLTADLHAANARAEQHRDTAESLGLQANEDHDLIMQLMARAEAAEKRAEQYRLAEGEAVLVLESTEYKLGQAIADAATLREAAYELAKASYELRRILCATKQPGRYYDWDMDYLDARGYLNAALATPGPGAAYRARAQKIEQAARRMDEASYHHKTCPCARERLLIIGKSEFREKCDCGRDMAADNLRAALNEGVNG